MHNDKNCNDPNNSKSDIPNPILILSLGHLLFEFASYFDIRISDFGGGLPLQIMPSALRPKPGPLDPDLCWFSVQRSGRRAL